MRGILSCTHFGIWRQVGLLTIWEGALSQLVSVNLSAVQQINRQFQLTPLATWILSNYNSLAIWRSLWVSPHLFPKLQLPTKPQQESFYSTNILFQTINRISHATLLMQYIYWHAGIVTNQVRLKTFFPEYWKPSSFCWCGGDLSGLWESGKLKWTCLGNNDPCEISSCTRKSRLIVGSWVSCSSLSL